MNSRALSCPHQSRCSIRRPTTATAMIACSSYLKHQRLMHRLRCCSQPNLYYSMTSTSLLAAKQSPQPSPLPLLVIIAEEALAITAVATVIARVAHAAAATVEKALFVPSHPSTCAGSTIYAARNILTCILKSSASWKYVLESRKTARLLLFTIVAADSEKKSTDKTINI